MKLTYILKKIIFKAIVLLLIQSMLAAVMPVSIAAAKGETETISPRISVNSPMVMEYFTPSVRKEDAGLFQSQDQLPKRKTSFGEKVKVFFRRVPLFVRISAGAVLVDQFSKFYAIRSGFYVEYHEYESGLIAVLNLPLVLEKMFLAVTVVIWGLAFSVCSIRVDRLKAVLPQGAAEVFSTAAGLAIAGSIQALVWLTLRPVPDFIPAHSYLFMQFHNPEPVLATLADFFYVLSYPLLLTAMAMIGFSSVKKISTAYMSSSTVLPEEYSTAAAEAEETTEPSGVEVKEKQVSVEPVNEDPAAQERAILENIRFLAEDYSGLCFSRSIWFIPALFASGLEASMVTTGDHFWLETENFVVDFSLNSNPLYIQAGFLGTDLFQEWKSSQGIISKDSRIANIYQGRRISVLSEEVGELAKKRIPAPLFHRISETMFLKETVQSVIALEGAV